MNPAGPDTKPLASSRIVLLTIVMLLIISVIAFVLVKILPSPTTTIRLVNESQPVEQLETPQENSGSILDR